GADHSGQQRNRAGRGAARRAEPSLCRRSRLAAPGAGRTGRPRGLSGRRPADDAEGRFLTMNWFEQGCREPDTGAEQAARQRQGQLTKPAGSLAALETLAIRLAGLQGRPLPSIDAIHIQLFAGDHGAVAEGVLASLHDARLEVLDLACATTHEQLPGVRELNLGPGTANFAAGPAMTAEQCASALLAGRECVQQAIADGCDLFIAGEMGIGNTTSASALACALLGATPAELTGRGTGLDDAGVRRKQQVIERALMLHADHLQSPLEALRRLGGFEVAAMTGAYLACAQEGVPALVDGFICSVAALVALHLNPGCRPWLLFAHRSAEPGHRAVLAALKADPLLDLGLRLGEGSGAALAVPLLRQACALHAQMATFAEAAVSGPAH